MQLGKPGIRAAAKESARFGIYLVVAVDIADYIIRDNATLGQLLGSLTVDIPSVLLATAVGTAIATSTIGGATGAATGVAVFVTSFACGPILVALAVGVIVAAALFEIDQYFGISDKLGDLYDSGLQKLKLAYEELGAEAELRFHQLSNSHIVQDLFQDVDQIAAKLGRKADWVRWELAHW
ncbi:hypothetical protein UCD39_13730 [Nitrospirillum sp. BR 11752]|uniref:hypothetical protein n=1 Tax=Nitrospirillum sp. BR 11752 TaxID=3104293 RepID=UPI002EA1A411|nr:hypothetical protein [Nitrospirillum sp. BR 11752]